MRNLPNQPLKSLLEVVLMTLLICLTVSGFSACSSADATAKKEKLKKSKQKRQAELEDQETADESDDNSEKTVANDSANGAESNSKSETNTAENKKTEKKNANEPNIDKKKKAKDGEKPAEKDKKSEKSKKSEAEAIWAELIKGNKNFMSGRQTAVNFSDVRAGMVKNQPPKVAVLSCSESRVPPEIVFDKHLGELFVVRDAGNIAGDASLGSLEYAVENLHVKVLVILGHESCGAVTAAVSGEKMPSKNLRAMVENITSAFEDSKNCPVGGKMNLACVELNVRHSAADVLQESPVIKESVEKGELTIIRAVYKLQTGEVVRLD